MLLFLKLAYFLRNDSCRKCIVAMWYMSDYPVPTRFVLLQAKCIPLRIEPLCQHTVCMLTSANDTQGKEAHKPVASEVRLYTDGDLVIRLTQRMFTMIKMASGWCIWSWDMLLIMVLMFPSRLWLASVKQWLTTIINFNLKYESTQYWCIVWYSQYYQHKLLITGNVKWDPILTMSVCQLLSF